MASTASLRIFVIILEILCSLLGAAILTFGIYVTYNFQESNTFFQIPIGVVYIIIGAATLLVFLLNCFGLVKCRPCGITSLLIFFSLLIVVQIAANIIIYKSIDPTSESIANTIDDAWESELKAPGAMSLYESWLECCGRVSPQDYIVNMRRPPSTCFKNRDDPNTLVTAGCRVHFENYWRQWLLIFDILSMILVALEILTSVMLCCLCNAIRNERRRQFI